MPDIGSVETDQQGTNSCRHGIRRNIGRRQIILSQWDRRQCRIETEAGRNRLAHSVLQITEIAHIAAKDCAGRGAAVAGYDRRHVELLGEARQAVRVASGAPLQEQRDGPLADHEIARPGNARRRLVNDSVACRVARAEMMQLDDTSAEVQLQVPRIENVRQAQLDIGGDLVLPFRAPRATT